MIIYRILQIKVNIANKLFFQNYSTSLCHKGKGGNANLKYHEIRKSNYDLKYNVNTSTT